jgi:hypothetical protein
MQEQKPNVEDSFRSSLQDVVTISEKLAPHCASVEEMTGMIKLALDNDGQLRLLMREFTSKK